MALDFFRLQLRHLQIDYATGLLTLISTFLSTSDLTENWVLTFPSQSTEDPPDTVTDKFLHAYSYQPPAPRKAI